MSNTDIAKQRTARIAQLIREEGVDHATAKLMVADEFTFATSAPQTAVAPAVTATVPAKTPAKVARVVVPFADLPATATFTLEAVINASGSWGYTNKQPTITLADGRVVKFTTICATVIGSKPKS